MFGGTACEERWWGLSMLRGRSKITVHDCLPSTDTCVFFVCFTDLHSPYIGVVQPKIVQFVLIFILVCGCVDLSPPLLPAGVQIIVYEEEDQREFVRGATSMCAWQAVSAAGWTCIKFVSDHL